MKLTTVDRLVHRLVWTELVEYFEDNGFAQNHLLPNALDFDCPKWVVPPARYWRGTGKEQLGSFLYLLQSAAHAHLPRAPTHNSSDLVFQT